MKAKTTQWCTSLALPVCLLFAGLFSIFPSAKMNVGLWFILSSLFLFWLARDDINKKSIAEGFVYAGALSIFAGGITFVAPWAGTYGPYQREDSYPALLVGLALGTLGFLARSFVTKDT